MIKDFLKAGYPAIYLVTQEPTRAEAEIQVDGIDFYAWDCIRGIRKAGTAVVVEDLTDPIEACQWLNKMKDTVLIVHNLQRFFEVVEILQSIQNGVNIWKAAGNCMVIVGPSAQLPAEVEKVFHMVDLPLPDADRLFEIQKELGESNEIELSWEAAAAAKGLTEFEAETAFAYSAVKGRSFNPEIITRIKSQMIRKTGLMEFWPPVPIDQVGGLDELKGYIRNRAKAYEKGSDLPRPKGVILVGIPGTGKSLSAKAAASILNLPLIRLDISACKGSLVGESEKNIRKVTSTLDGFGGCVLWLDEVEKALGSAKGAAAAGTGDTTTSMLGHLLTWMEETKVPPFMVATCNDISPLKSEFVRRFDDTWFVDCPNLSEREQILAIMCGRYRTEIPREVAAKLEGYTGAEIEKVVRKSVFDGLEKAVATVIPIARTMRDDIDSLRSWATSKALRANAPEAAVTEGRKMRID